jgi:hypothetical protein
MKSELFFLILKIDSPTGTEFLAGLAFAFFKEDTVLCINCIFKGDGLRILYVYCLSFIERLVVFIVYLSGALFRAQTAGYALIDINVSGVLGNGDLKVSFFPLYIVYL